LKPKPDDADDIVPPRMCRNLLGIEAGDGDVGF
jgi:hypothetical protein